MIDLEEPMFQMVTISGDDRDSILITICWQVFRMPVLPFHIGTDECAHQASGLPPDTGRAWQNYVEKLRFSSVLSGRFHKPP
jgi:hypothetical protein